MIKQILASITRKEWQLVILLSLFVIIITTAPMIYGLAVVPANQEFMGVHFSAPNDWFVYYSYINQVKSGQFLVENLFTAEPQMPTLNILWLAVGWLARVFDLSPFVAFQIARIGLIPIFMIVAYLLIATIFSDRLKRQLSLMILTFSSGLGLLLINRLIKYPYNFANGQFNWPLDLWVPEAFTYLTLHYSPHFIASVTLILLIFWLTLLFSLKPNYWYSVIAGLLGLTLFSFHPFHVLTIYGFIPVFFLALIIRDQTWRWPLVWHHLIFSMLALPSVIYYLYLIKADAVVAQKTLQNLTLTPPWWIVFFSYGLLLILAIAAISWMIKNKKQSNQDLFLMVWAVFQLGLIFIPVPWQRRMTAGLHFPLALLTTVALVEAYIWSTRNQRPLAQFCHQQRYSLAIGLGVFLIISNVFHLAVNYYMYSNHLNLSYLDTSRISAARWLNNEPRGVVLNTAANIINYLPAFANQRVYVGHGVETLFFGFKQGEVNWFFKTNRPREIEINFLHQRGITLIYYGPDEQALGQYNPASKDYLQEVYHNNQVIVYRVL